MTHHPNNIYSGTKVVSLIEVKGPNDTLLHPRGSVGVVTRTPAVDVEKFLVRFPDGFEKSMDRSDIEILNHFKDRLDDGNHLANFGLDASIIYSCVIGSRAYGLDTEESDTDLRGVYLAPAELQWSLYGMPEQFEYNSQQSCYWELQKFLLMALKATPNVLECLYSPMVEKSAALGQELLGIRDGLLSQMIFQTYNSQPYPLLFATISGAHLYGFPSPDSDFDLRAAYVLPLDRVVGLDLSDETVEDSRIVRGMEMRLTHPGPQ